MLNLEVGKKYITKHNSPIVITAFEFDGTKYTKVYATWPSGNTYSVNNPEHIVKIFSLDVGDEVSNTNDGPYYKVISIDGDCFKTKDLPGLWATKHIFKIKKRLPKVGEIVWLNFNDRNEFKVSEVYPREGKFKVNGVRFKGTVTKFKIVSQWLMDKFFTNEDVVNFGFDLYAEELPPIFKYIEDPMLVSKGTILFKTLKNRNGRYYEPSMLDKAYKDFMMEQTYYRAVLAGPPGTILAAPIVTHNGITEKYLTTGEKMKVTDFDKENLKAGKEDAIAKKKEYEREQAQLVYARLLTTLDEINARIKNLEAQKKAVEKEMAEFD